MSFEFLVVVRMEGKGRERKGEDDDVLKLNLFLGFFIILLSLGKSLYIFMIRTQLKIYVPRK